MMNALLERINQKAEQDRLAAEAEWQTVVEKLAVDTGTEKEILGAIKATGRSLDELQSAVGWQKRILDLRSVLTTWPEVEHAAQKAEAAFQAFCLRRQTNFRSERDECAVLTAAVQDAQTAVEVVAAAKRDLEELLQSPIEFPAVAEVQNELADVVEAIA